MSFYDDASWLLIPSGIKEDVVYAQKPTSGLGDLTFTRASDATYTDASGVVRRSPYNLYQFSNAFTNAAWLSGGGGTAVFTDNFAEGPTGVGNASRWTAAAIDSQVRQNVATVGTTGTLSIYLRTISGTKQVRLFINDTTVQQTVTVTTSWQRFTLTGAVGSSLAGSGRVGFANLSVLTNSDYILAAGAQYVEGTSALDYFPTTNRQDVPRIDFRNADGTLSSCGRLLLEPQRTNSIRNSSMVGAVAGSPGTLPTNYVMSALAGLTQTVVGTGTENGLPYVDLRFNGTASASALRFTTDASTAIAALPSQIWTNSCYFKLVAGVLPYITLRTIYRNSGAGAISTPQLQFDLTTTLTRRSFTDAASPALTAFIQQEILVSLVIGQTYDFTIRIAAPQMELGAYATTWVPTTTAAVTRLADTASKTGVSSLIGQTEGTLFVEANLGNFVTNAGILTVSDGTNNNIIAITTFSSNRVRLLVRTGGSGQVAINSSTYTAGNFKIAVAYKASDFAIYINGVQVAVQSSGTIPSCPNIYVGTAGDGTTNPLSDRITQATLFPTRLDNATLAQLTTL